MTDKKPKAPAFTMHPVAKSSQIASIGHCCETNCLCVHFKGGGVYHYHGVGAELFEQFRKAESAGKFLAANIKSKFKFTKV